MMVCVETAPEPDFHRGYTSSVQDFQQPMKLLLWCRDGNSVTVKADRNICLEDCWLVYVKSNRSGYIPQNSL